MIDDGEVEGKGENLSPSLIRLIRAASVSLKITANMSQRSIEVCLHVLPSIGSLSSISVLVYTTSLMTIALSSWYSRYFNSPPAWYGEVARYRSNRMFCKFLLIIFSISSSQLFLCIHNIRINLSKILVSLFFLQLAIPILLLLTELSHS